MAGQRTPHANVSSNGDNIVAELIAAYWKHAEQHYRKNGQPTSELGNFRTVLRDLRQLYGSISVAEFTPSKLKAVRRTWLSRDYVRRTINEHMRRLVSVFRWGVSEELVEPSVLQALAAVRGLQKGRTEARESEPVRPVDDEIVDKTLEHLGGIVGDMVRIQRLIGCRPDEVCQMRPCDLDRSSDVWGYRPASHKTEHHGHVRAIPVGPRAQAILAPYLLRDPQSYCFSPAESVKQRLRERHLARTTKLTYGNSPGTNRKRKPKRAPGKRYTDDSYPQQDRTARATLD